MKRHNIFGMQVYILRLAMSGGLTIKVTHTHRVKIKVTGYYYILYNDPNN